MADIIVLGAGMIGVCTALALQAAGRDVVLVDRKPVGSETSYGNAGLIQAEAVEPYAFPHDLGVVIKTALKKNSDVNYHFNALPSHAKKLWSYFRNSDPKKHKKISALYSGLVQQATTDHAPLIDESGSRHLIKTTGFKDVFVDEKSFAQGCKNAERLENDYGVGIKLLDGDQLSRSEPALRCKLGGAVLWQDAWSCTDPGGLVAAYARLFVGRGGVLANGDANSLKEKGEAWLVTTDVGVIEAPDIVVALGPWSDELLFKLGYNFPILRKRGYHRHFSTAAKLNTPLFFTNASMVLAPMEQGLRLLTGAEIALRNSQLTPVQLRNAESKARELIDLGTGIEVTAWAGSRPCMPDMLPVIGKGWKHKGLWMHFGHGHQGFTLGPTTSKLLADAIADGREIHSMLAPHRYA